jgi:hypothetical protein
LIKELTMTTTNTTTITARSSFKNSGFRNSAVASSVALVALSTAFAACSGSSGDDSGVQNQSDASSGSDGSLTGNDGSSSNKDGSSGGGCAADQTTCGGECVNTSRDNANCGTCGHTCASGDVCSAGTCALTCSAPTTMCTGVANIPPVVDAGADAGDAGDASTPVVDAGTRAPYCASLSSDNENCGACGFVCPGSTSCREGSCAHYSGVTGAWAPVATEPGNKYGGFSDFSPAGQTVFYGTDYLGGFYRYDEAPANAWTTLTSSPEPISTPGDFAGPAWVGNKLYGIALDEVMVYDIASNVWTPHLTATATSVGYEVQDTHDDSGHVYAIKSDGNLLKYDIAGDALTTVTLSAPLASNSEARMAWDSATHLLITAPSYDGTELDSIDPATGTVTLLAPVPGAQMSDIFCGDRNGHIYANGGDNTVTLYQYVIATNTWTLLSNNPPPFSGANQGSCTVTSDGWLYYTDGLGNIAKLQLF